MLRWILNLLSVALLCALATGLAARGRWRASRSFSAYVLAVLASDALALAWPDRLLNWEAWLLKEMVHAALKFWIALAVAQRTVRAFPGARFMTRRVLLLVLGLAWLGVVSLPVDPTSGRAMLGGVLPRILNGTVWVFVAVSAVVLWYRLPVSRLDKALLVGFVPYLLVFTVSLTLLESLGWGADVVRGMGHIQASAYELLLLYWNGVVWSASSVEDLGRAALPALAEPAPAGGALPELRG